MKDKKKTTNGIKNIPRNWYFMSRDNITVRDIKNVLEDDSLDVEIWDAAGILEIGFAPKASIDMESCDLDLRDEFSNNFLKENDVKSLFYVSCNPEYYESYKPILKKIGDSLSGFICGDTDDFKPTL